MQVSIDYVDHMLGGSGSVQMELDALPTWLVSRPGYSISRIEPRPARISSEVTQVYNNAKKKARLDLASYLQNQY